MVSHNDFGPFSELFHSQRIARFLDVFRLPSQAYLQFPPRRSTHHLLRNDTYNMWSDFGPVWTRFGGFLGVEMLLISLYCFRLTPTLTLTLPFHVVTRSVVAPLEPTTTETLH